MKTRKTIETSETDCKHWNKICSFAKEYENKQYKMSFGIPLDTTLDSMEETRFKTKHSALFQRLVKKLHFSYTELECIMLIYYKIQKESPDKSGVTRAQFRDVLHSSFNMTEDMLMERIFAAFDKGTKNPVSVQIISMEAWANAMSLFLRGTLEEKIEYCFNVYDIMGDGLIVRDTMFHFMRNSLVKQPGEDDADEGVKDMVDVITKKMDLDRDGKISFKDYRESVLQRPLLLEVFGKVLPSRRAVYTFLTTFTEYVGKM